MRRMVVILLLGLAAVPALAVETPAENFSGLRTGAPELLRLADTLEKGSSSYRSLRGYEALFLKREISGTARVEEEKIYL